jgi:hypothetical protein
LNANRDNETLKIMAVDRVPSRIDMLEGNMDWLINAPFLIKSGVFY